MLQNHLHQRFCVKSVFFVCLFFWFLLRTFNALRLRFSLLVSYLRVCQAEHGSQLLSVRFGDVFLDLKSLLQPLSLQVREDCPGPRSFPLVRLRHRVLCQDCVRPWKTQGGGGGERREDRNHSHLSGVIKLRRPSLLPAPALSSQSLPGKVSWNWCWPDCLPLPPVLLLLPSALIMEAASFIPESMEEKYWLADGWTGMCIPDWRFELTMDVRSVAERELKIGLFNFCVSASVFEQSPCCCLQLISELWPLWFWS